MKILSYVAVHVFQDEGSYNLEYYLNEIWGIIQNNSVKENLIKWME